MSYGGATGDGRLGGGPADAIGAIQRANRGVPGMGRPSQGGKGFGNPDPVRDLDRSVQSKGDLVEFTYSPDLPKPGFQWPADSDQRYFAGLVFIEMIEQKQTGWKVLGVSQEFSHETIDGFSGKIPQPLKMLDGLPRDIVQPDDRR